MSGPIPYVMFGTHQQLGDYADAIHACGGILKRIVRNVEEPPRDPGDAFEDRLDFYHRWLDAQGIHHRVQVEWLDEYEPCDNEVPFAGFRGPKLEPLVQHLKERFGTVFPPLVHPTAYVSPMATLEEGVFVGPFSVIGVNVHVGRFTTLTRAVSLSHDSLLAPHVIIGPGATIASRVRLQVGCWIGIGATVLEKVIIGEGSYVAGRALVMKDVPPFRMVAGVPAVDKKEFRRS